MNVEDVMLESNKPIIGIVSKHLLKKERRPNMYVRDEIKQAVFDNEAIAIGILLPKEEKSDVNDKWENNLNEKEYDNLVAQIKLCDGIIFQGGSVSDNYEMVAAKYCYDNDIPTLGICCGQNVMVRALGGTTKLVDNPEKHRDIINTYVHDVNICKDSKFYEIVRKERIFVNSRHKRTIEKHPLLNVNCLCDDGYIDGLEAPDKLFYMAFRFHPESLYKIDENHNKIFKEFVRVCKEVKIKKSRKIN